MEVENKEQNHTPRHKSIISKIVKNIPTVNLNLTVGTVIDLLLKKSTEFETIHYIYVTDDSNRLKGVISIKELFVLPREVKLIEHVQKELIVAHPHTHQERVAMLAIRHALKGIPVVDKDNVFLGIVPSDMILNILHEEHVEDILKLEGISTRGEAARDIINISSGSYFRRRLPWLALGLVSSLLTALIISSFENTLKELFILSAFIPAIVYIADAVGSQSQTIFIRSIAINPALNLRGYLNREAWVGLGLALTLGLIIGTISYLVWMPPALGLILGISFFITILAAILVAIFLPWLFMRIKIDPALASGPFATIIRDVCSVFLYFSIANLILGI